MAQFQPSTPTGETCAGTIIEIGKKFGFIHSDAVRLLHNDDVWCPSSALFGFGVGENVEFDLTLSRKGQPQASNVRRPGTLSFQQLPPPAQGEIHNGVVMEIGKRFAFIDCPEVKARYNNDVFCLSSSLMGYTAGAPVEFELMVNEKGQPQAAKVRPAAQQQRPALQHPRLVVPCSVGKGGGGSRPIAAGDTSVQGVIKEIGRRLAFIDSDYVRAQCSDDVFAPSAALVGMTVGEEVLFDLVFNGKGQPQARNVRSASALGLRPLGKAGGKAPEGPLAPQSMPTGETYQGNISDIGRKYAFIASAQAKAFYGDDVFCPARAVAGFSVGQEVEFDLLLSAKGQPQAANVRPISGAVAEGSFIVRGCSGTPTGESYEGSISEIGKKLAFIASEKVKEKYANDVFVPSHMLQGFSVGEAVHFDLVTNGKGQPQAQNIKRSGGFRAAPY